MSKLGSDKKLTQNLLEAIEKMLNLDNKFELEGFDAVCWHFQECGGIEIIESFQVHNDPQFVEQASNILSSHFDDNVMQTTTEEYGN